MFHPRSMNAPTMAKGACVALALSGAMIAMAKPPVDTVDNPVVSPPTRGPVTPVRSSGDEGTLAGNVIWDNGPISTGEPHACAVPGTRSTLQAGLGTYGFGLWAGTDGIPDTVVGDDFLLTECAQVTEVEVYGYQTGATTTTVTGAFVTLHAGRPSCPSSSIVATLNATVGGGAIVDFTDIYRALPGDVPPGAGCTRRLNRVRIDTSAWPLLPPGEYWLSWSLQGGTSKFCPPVTILGQQGKPGANSIQSTGNGGQFAALVDVVPQDMPFILRGTTEPCGDCPEDVTGDNTVGVADLLSVISAWGPCPGCPEDVNGDNTVGVADLLAVIAAWGPCGGGGPPPFPQDTGACCTGGSCAVTNFSDCLAGGGVYYGDDSTCAAIGSCTITNDECAGALPLSTGVTTIYTNAATASPEASACSAAGIGSDRWYSINVVPGVLYTIDTLQTAGCDAWLDTVVEIFESCGGASYACDDDGGGTVGGPSVVSFGVIEPTTLFVRVGSWNSVNPGGRIVVNFTQQ